MAGDWIKMRGNLWDDPRVARLCDITDQPEAAIVGGLYWLWATADQHTEDGVMPGLTLRSIDRKTGISGFGKGLCEIGWLEEQPDGVRIVNFEEHNGQSAKRRCTDAQRKANIRSVSALDADKKRTDDGNDADKKRRGAELEKEKRREEKEYLAVGFDRFWNAYPRKQAKADAVKAFAKLAPDNALLTTMLSALSRQAASEQWKKDGGQFVPYPASWLNARRWEDEIVDDDPFDMKRAL